MHSESMSVRKLTATGSTGVLRLETLTGGKGNIAALLRTEHQQVITAFNILKENW
jgi:hypothetical protein